jgi:phage gp29-like protein
MDEITKKTKVTTDEIATIEKDIDMFAGWIKRLENPDPVLRSEAAGRGLRLYDEIERDAHAGSVLQQRAMAVVGKEWEIIPAKSARKLGRPSSTTQEQVIADFVSQTLLDCNFDQARQELLKAILYGHYEAEIIWKAVGGSLRIKKLIGKHPRRFVFTPGRELRLLTLQNMIDGEALPERKFITFTYSDSDNPYGKGLGQSLWWPVWFKKHGIKFWMVFLEKFGMPTTVGKYPSGTLDAAKKTLLNAIEAIQTDTGITMPDNMSVEFLEASRTGSVTHEQLCEYMDKQISKRVLGQTATTEGTAGKLGNEETQGETKQELTEADADLLDACLNDTLIKWIVDYNFPDVKAYPQIKTFANANADLAGRVAVDKTLVVDIGLPVGKAYFYETYGIPQPADGEDLVNVPPRTQPIGGWGSQTAFTEELALSQDAADVIAAKTAQQGLQATDEIYMVPLKKLVSQAQSLDELRDRIADLWGQMEPESLGTIMARGLMLADMAGRYEASAEASTEKVKKKV